MRVDSFLHLPCSVVMMIIMLLAVAVEQVGELGVEVGGEQLKVGDNFQVVLAKEDLRNLNNE